MQNVVVVMPVYGRYQMSIDAMKRLQETATYQARYVAVGGTAEMPTLKAMSAIPGVKAIAGQVDTVTYWQGLDVATRDEADNVLIATVASDVLPVVHWLRNAVETWEQHGPRDILVGFNGDGYTPRAHDGFAHSAHFLISMSRIRWYGGWPVWYRHNFGDTEIVQRSWATGDYQKSPWAILFHNHPGVAAASTDDVYKKGSEQFEIDRALFVKREKSQWK